ISLGAGLGRYSHRCASDGGGATLKRLAMVRAAAAVVGTAAFLTCAAGAEAQRPASLGAGAPAGQSGIQLYNFSGYLSSGAGEITCPAPPAEPTPHCVAPPAPTT